MQRDRGPHGRLRVPECGFVNSPCHCSALEILPPCSVPESVWCLGCFWDITSVDFMQEVEGREPI